MKSLSVFGLRWIWLLSILTLTACQSVQGSWYFQKEPSRQPLSEGCDQESRLCLYLNVTNISKVDFRANKIRVFTQLPSGLPFTDRRKELWECRYRGASDDESTAYVWRPGQTVVLTLPHHGDAACMIPMDAELVVREHPVRVRITGNQPSSIPAAWLNCSRWPSGADGNADVVASRADLQTTESAAASNDTSGKSELNSESKKPKPVPEPLPMLFECKNDLRINQH